MSLFGVISWYYDIEVEFANDHFARMIEALEERGELENTVIVVTSRSRNARFPVLKLPVCTDETPRVSL